MSNDSYIKKPKKGKGLPPSPEETTRNLERPSDEEMVNLNFKVPSAFKKRFKTFCSEQGMNMKDVLMVLFEEHRDSLIR